MRWSFARTLANTAGPAVGILLAKTMVDFYRADGTARAAEIVAINAGMVAVLWLFVAVGMWLLRKMMPPTP